MELDSTYPELTTLKVVHNGLARRVKVPYDMEWNDFEHKVCRLFNISPPLVTSYKDSMGVSVIVDNSDDFFFFLDEEYTGRLDIVSGVETSEASDWTVVRTDAGKALKEIDRSSELSLSDNLSDKSKTESGLIRLESVSPASSPLNLSRGQEKNPVVSTESLHRDTTPEVLQVTAPDTSLPAEVENIIFEYTSLDITSDLKTQKIKFTPDLRSSNSPVIFDQFVAEATQKENLDSTDVHNSEEPNKELDAKAKSSPSEDNGIQIQTPRLSNVKSEIDAPPKDYLKPEAQGDGFGLSFQGGFNNLTKEPIIASKSTSGDEIKSVSDVTKEQEVTSPLDAGFHEFAEALVSDLFGAEKIYSNPELTPTHREQEHKSESVNELSNNYTTSGQELGEDEEFQEGEATKPSSPAADEFTFLKKGTELRNLCVKFDEVFRRHPSLFTTIYLFTDQITHGVPIDLEIFENSLRRLAPPSRESPPGLVLDVASNLFESVGSIINHVGSSIGSLIEKDISKLLLPKHSASRYESRDAGLNASQRTSRFPDLPSEESPEARKCRRRSLRHGCTCHKLRSGHIENEGDSPALEDHEGRRHHRRHRRKRKSHVCSVHHLDSTNPPEEHQPESALKPKVETYASSSTTVLPTIAVCPSKLPEFSRSKLSQTCPSPLKDNPHPSVLTNAKQNGINPFTSRKNDLLDNNVERFRRPYSLKSLIMSPNVESYTSTPYTEPSRDLGQDIKPEDVALISGIVALRDMGFHDDAANLDALQAHFGRLEDAIEELLKF